MEIYQLKAFIAVSRTGNMTRAAEQLHLTQSAVSKQLKALEEEFGAPLFERGPAGMSLSALGKRLMPLARQTLDAVAEMAAAAKLMQGQVCGTLRLGTIIDPKSIRLGELLLELQRHHPGIEVRLEHGISGGVLQRLRNDEIDACFFLGAIDDADLKVVQLCMESYVVAAPAAWSERVQGRGWAELAALPWIGTPKGGSQTVIVDRVMREHGVVRRSVIEADQESSMIALVRSGVGLCLIRERLVQDLGTEGGLVFWDGARIPCPLSLLLRAQDATRPLNAALLERLFQVWPGAVYQ